MINTYGFYTNLSGIISVSTRLLSLLSSSNERNITKEQLRSQPMWYVSEPVTVYIREMGHAHIYINRVFNRYILMLSIFVSEVSSDGCRCRWHGVVIWVYTYTVVLGLFFVSYEWDRTMGMAWWNVILLSLESLSCGDMFLFNSSMRTRKFS